MNDDDQFIARIETALSGIREAIQCPQPKFVLKTFVLGQHETDGQRFAQAGVELYNRLQNLKRSAVSKRKLRRRIDWLDGIAGSDESERRRHNAEDAAAMSRIDLEDLEMAELGTKREAEALIELLAEFGRVWTRDELDAQLPELYLRRILRQAAMDVNATGRVSVGNQEALRQLGIPVPGLPGYIPEVEQRYLEVGKTKILVAIPTLIPRAEIEKNGLRCLEGWSLPGTVNAKQFVIDGRHVADAYNEAARVALQDGCTHMLTVEDDQIIPQGSFERIWALWKQSGPRTIVGAWYPMKTEPRQGAPIVLRNGAREPLADDGAVHEVYTVPQGFTLIPMSVFNDVGHPWFATTGCLTQDSFFSQVAREAGYKLLVDTSVRIKHVCRETGRVYE